MDRRSVLTGLAALAAGSLHSRTAQGAGESSEGDTAQAFGVGLFTIPSLLDEDFGGAMEMLAAIGYEEVETFGPYTFSAPEAIQRWAGIAQTIGLKGSGLYGHSAKEVRKILDRHGLRSPAMHTDLISLETGLDRLAEAAHVLGQTWVILPAIPEEERVDLDAYKRMADRFNRIGQNAVKNGVRFAYHNHGYGLAEMEGEIPLDLLLERTDPGLVDLEMDLYWTVAGGADPVAYLDAHPGRYRLIHIKDMTKPVRFSGDGGTPAQWFELWPYIANAAGDGVLDLKRILSHAKASGARHLLVERDLVENPRQALEASYGHLAGLGL